MGQSQGYPEATETELTQVGWYDRFLMCFQTQPDFSDYLPLLLHMPSNKAMRSSPLSLGTLWSQASVSRNHATHYHRFKELNPKVVHFISANTPLLP